LISPFFFTVSSVFLAAETRVLKGWLGGLFI